MPKVFQVHFIAEIKPTIVSENKDINGQVTVPQILKTYKYVVAKNATDAKIKAFSQRNKDDEIYALQVSKNTVLDEITHCKELIALWNSKSESIKKQERVDDCIIPRQKNLIKYYEDILKELKDA